jgi:hypothetical protein
VAWLVTDRDFKTLAQAVAFVKKQKKGKQWPQPEPWPEARYPRRNPEWLEEEEEGELIDLTPRHFSQLPGGRFRLGETYLGAHHYPGSA